MSCAIIFVYYKKSLKVGENWEICLIPQVGIGANS